MTKRRLCETHEAYTREQIAHILQTVSFATKGEGDPVIEERFVKELQEIAWRDCLWESIVVNAGTPSEQERRWRARAKQVGKVVGWLKELYGGDDLDAGNDLDGDDNSPAAALTSRDLDRACLEHAAKELTANYDPLGEEDGQARISKLLERHQTALERLWELDILLPWLQRCCKLVANRAAAEKADAGSNRASEGLESLVRHLTALFKKYSTEPATAYNDRILGQPGGRLVDFIEACLTLLGYQGSRNSILDTIQKCKGERRDP